MSGINQRTKMYHYIGCTASCLITDGRIIKGKLLAYDRYLNLVVADAEEIRKEGKGDKATEETRPLGLVILRGHYVTSITVMGAVNKVIMAERDEIANNPVRKVAVNLPPSSSLATAMPPQGMYPHGGMPPAMMPPPGYGPPPGMHAPMGALPPPPPGRY